MGAFGPGSFSCLQQLQQLCRMGTSSRGCQVLQLGQQGRTGEAAHPGLCVLCHDQLRGLRRRLVRLLPASGSGVLAA